MTNKEAADKLRYAINLIKQDCKDWLDERDIPVLEMAISALQEQEELYVYSQCKTCRYYHDDDVRCMICDDENDMYEGQEAKAQLSVEGTTSDLISRQAAIAYAISGRIRTLPTSEDGENWIRTEEVRQSLLNMPSAQPEIIHCRECQHHRRDNTGCYYCVRKEYGYGWGLNDFCSDAERRTDDQSK